MKRSRIARLLGLREEIVHVVLNNIAGKVSSSAGLRSALIRLQHATEDTAGRSSLTKQIANSNTDLACRRLSEQYPNSLQAYPDLRKQFENKWDGLTRRNIGYIPPKPELQSLQLIKSVHENARKGSRAKEEAGIFWDETVDRALATARNLRDYAMVYDRSREGGLAKERAKRSLKRESLKEATAAKTFDKLNRVYHLSIPGSSAKKLAWRKINRIVLVRLAKANSPKQITAVLEIAKVGSQSYVKGAAKWKRVAFAAIQETNSVKRITYIIRNAPETIISSSAHVLAIRKLAKIQTRRKVRRNRARK